MNRTISGSSPASNHKMSRRVIAVFLSTLMLLVSVAPGTTFISTAGASTQVPSSNELLVSGTFRNDVAWEVLELVNEYRISEGLVPLQMNSRLVELADIRAAECFVNMNTEYGRGHVRPNNTRALEMVMTPGETGWFAVNGLTGHRSAQEMFNGWMNSAGHRRNILDDRARYIGIGVFFAGDEGIFNGGTPFSTGAYQFFRSQQPIGSTNLTAPLANRSVVQSVAVCGDWLDFEWFITRENNFLAPAQTVNMETEHRYRLAVRISSAGMQSSGQYQIRSNTVRIADTADFVWSSSGAALEVVDAQQGTFRAAAPGTASIVATGHGVTIASAPITVNAVQRTVTLDPRGGTVNPTIMQVLHGDEVGALPTPAKANHTFSGWWTTPAAGGTQITAITTITGNMTVYARWTQNQQPPPTQYTITFNPQGGSVVAARTVQDGQAIGELPTPTRTSHTFAGWWTQASGGTQITAAFVPTGNITLHARWTQNQPPPQNHTITFNSQGGSAVAARTVTAGQAIGTLPTPTRTNYTFNGWWTQATGGIQVSATTVVNNNLTLHARWISNAPTAITITAPRSNIIVRGRTLNLGTRTNFSFNAGATQDRTVTWTSSNTRVATVDASGVITGRNPGSATIRVRSDINQNATATFNIRVEAAPTGINTATQNIRTIRMRQGATLSLPIVVRGSTASSLNNTPVTINWRTNNRNVATLRGAGTATIDGRRASASFRTNLNATRNLSLRAVGTGTTTIVLTSQNGRQRTIRVQVVRNARPVTNVRIANLPSNNTMNRNTARTLTPRITPNNATLQGNVRWTSSNTRVATVDGAGRVTTRTSGTTNITLRVGTQTHRVILRVR